MELVEAAPTAVVVDIAVAVEDMCLQVWEELEALEEQAYKDIKSGCYVRFDIHTIRGFKPS